MEDKPRCSGADFCDELNGANRTSFTLTYEGDPPSRVIVDAGALKLVADMSPLMVGHMLILPVKHYLSFGEAAEELAPEIEAFGEFVLNRYRQVFGSALVLEHGSSSNMAAGACITHAHWHLVPLDGSEANEIVVGDGFSAQTLQSFVELKRFASADTAYFYLAFDNRHIAYTGDLTVRRQYLRYVMAAILGIPDPLWDYAVVVRKELLRETMRVTQSWNIGAPRFR